MTLDLTLSCPTAPGRLAIRDDWFVGLVHGFGFASTLAALDLPRKNLALALLGFNLGVEVGQALVVALLLPLLIWIHHWQWQPKMVRAASLASAAVGLAWFFERLFL